MQHAGPGDASRLRAAVRAAPRRYRMPPLPADLDAALAAGPEATLAFAMEALRTARATPAVRHAFLAALAQLVRRAAAGDTTFQAQVLRARQPQVQEYVRLAGGSGADRRALRMAVDAIAHPAKLRGMAPGPAREALLQAHALTATQDWSALAAALRAAADPRLAALGAHPALQRLLRGQDLLQSEAVQRYLALCARSGPPAGSEDALDDGRAAARSGDLAEQATVRAFRRLARPGQRVVRSLRPPAGFAAPRHGAKDEFDVALVDADEVVLLAEVKASPAAAATDLPRLRRGLERLAQAQAEAVHPFGSADGVVLLRGATLRALAPQGEALPEQVIYCSTALEEAPPPLLGAAARAMLLAQPNSLAFAAAPSAMPEALAPVWDALQQPRLRAVLQQYEAARLAREAMMHPDDLLAAADSSCA